MWTEELYEVGPRGSGPSHRCVSPSYSASCERSHPNERKIIGLGLKLNRTKVNTKRTKDRLTQTQNTCGGAGRGHTGVVSC